MSAIHGRLYSNRIVQFTDAYPEIEMCKSETFVPKKENAIHGRLSCKKKKKSRSTCNGEYVPYASALKSEPTNIQIVTQHIPS